MEFPCIVMLWSGSSDRRFILGSLLKSYCGGHLRPHLANETVLEILAYAQVRCGFCAPCGWPSSLRFSTDCYHSSQPCKK